MTPGPLLRCPPLPELEPTPERAAAAFAGSEACPLRQAWRPTPEAGLRPGAVLVGRRNDTLWAFADLEDADAFSPATRLNERLWELGDTWELFLEAPGAGCYVELHVAPGNQRLQLRIPIPRPAGRAPEELMVAEPLFQSWAWKTPSGWQALAAVPFSSIGGRPERFSFSRYDYTRGQAEPVLSSTSPHAALDFHRREEWGRLVYS